MLDCPTPQLLQTCLRQEDMCGTAPAPPENHREPHAGGGFSSRGKTLAWVFAIWQNWRPSEPATGWSHHLLKSPLQMDSLKPCVAIVKRCPRVSHVTVFPPYFQMAVTHLHPWSASTRGQQTLQQFHAGSPQAPAPPPAEIPANSGAQGQLSRARYQTAEQRPKQHLNWGGTTTL